MIVLTLPYPISAAGVYRIDDVTSERFYIGSSVNIAKRWAQHVGRMKRGTHPNPILQAIWKVDPSRLTVGVIELVERSADALLQAEQRALDFAGVGSNPKCMNVLRVAGSPIGVKRRPETIARMSAAHTGKKHSPEAREKMRAAKLGKKQSEEHRRRSGEARRGIKINRRSGISRQLTLRTLTEEQVLDLRAKRKAGMSWRLLGLHFGLHRSVAKRVAIGETYKELAL